jgi:short-subunit dehydrogenase
MTVLILGGTTGLGRTLTYELAKQGNSIIFTGRDKRDLDAILSHLNLVTSTIHLGLVLDLCSHNSISEFIVKLSKLDFGITQVFLPIAESQDIDTIHIDPSNLHRLVRTNFSGIVEVVSGILSECSTENLRNITGFGSVAAFSGRSKNVSYSAAKRAQESYFESLMVGLSTTQISCHFFRLGYLDTGKTKAIKLIFPKVSTEKVARYVLSKKNKKSRIYTFPRFWSLIGFAVRHSPLSIKVRLDRIS